MQNKKLVMIPGPTPVVRSIQNQMGRETAAFGDPEFVKDFKETLDGLRRVVNLKSGEVFLISGTGTLGMEAAIANLTKRGDNVLICSNGFFGDRFINLCTRKGLSADVLSVPWGESITPDMIDKKLAEKKYSAVTVTHVDTSTGVLADIGAIGEVLKRYPECMYIVDGVCATGAEPTDMEKMNIDLLFTGSQKAFGVPPGLVMVWANEAAMARHLSISPIPEYYCDFSNWLPIMHDTSKYFATPSVNMVWAMKEAVSIILNEGTHNRAARHAKNGAAVQKALLALGFKLLAKEGVRASTLSNVIYPEGTDDLKFRQTLAAEGVMVAGGLGAYAGKMFRIGHMGNIDSHDLVSAVAAIERAMYKTGMSVKPGTGVAALQEALLEG